MQRPRNPYSSAEIDRASHERENEERMIELASSGAARFVPIDTEKNLVSKGGGNPEPIFLQGMMARAVVGAADHQIFLGYVDGTPYFAVDVSGKDTPLAEMGEFVDLRQFGSLLFAKEANIQVVHVPYNGSSANVLALASGDSHVAFDVLQALTPHVQSGKVRILAVGNAERFELAPQYPGMKESGFGLEITAINGTTAKAGTPREAIVKFNAAVNAAIREPKLVEYFSKVGQKLYGGTPEELGRLINAEYEAFGQVIREYNIKFD